MASWERHIQTSEYFENCIYFIWHPLVWRMGKATSNLLWPRHCDGCWYCYGIKQNCSCLQENCSLVWGKNKIKSVQLQIVMKALMEKTCGATIWMSIKSATGLSEEGTAHVTVWGAQMHGVLRKNPLRLEHREMLKIILERPGHVWGTVLSVNESG